MSDQIFGTPLFVFDVPNTGALTAELGRVLRDEAVTTPSISVSNRGSWHSIPDLALRDAPVFKELSSTVVEHFRYATEYAARHNGMRQIPAFGISLTAWAMVMGHGNYTVLHDHPEATWSSAFYVDAGDPPTADAPDAGGLTFIAPRRATAPVIGMNLFPSEYAVTPVTGRLVIFPGYLQHYVHPYLGQRPRIAIAANASIRVTDLRPPA